MQYKYIKYDINILIKHKYEVQRPPGGHKSVQGSLGKLS